MLGVVSAPGGKRLTLYSAHNLVPSLDAILDAVLDSDLKDTGAQESRDEVSDRVFRADNVHDAGRRGRGQSSLLDRFGGVSDRGRHEAGRLQDRRDARDGRTGCAQRGRDRLLRLLTSGAFDGPPSDSLDSSRATSAGRRRVAGRRCELVKERRASGLEHVASHNSSAVRGVLLGRRRRGGAGLSRLRRGRRSV